MRTHQPLRIVLYVLSAVEGLAGLALLFATPWFLSMTPQVLVVANGAFVVALLKGVGILVLALGYLLCVTARDPVRYVAIIDTLVFILAAAAALNVYAVFAMHLSVFYPASYLLSRAALQAALAIALIAMRPKEIRSTQPA